MLTFDADFGLNGCMSWEQLNDVLSKELVNLGSSKITLGGIIQAVLMILAVVYGSRFVRSIILKALSRAPHMDQGSRNAIATVAYYIILALGLGWVLNTIVDASSIAVFTGALGLGIGLGFQDVAKNFISGIIMLLGKTIKPHDVITVGDLTGRVEVVGMYSSTMKTVYDATVIIPNSQILSEKFINWTHDGEERMLDIEVGVHYDSDLDVVMKCMVEAAGRVEDIRNEPPVRILLTGYGASSVDFRARVWTGEVMYSQRVVSAFYLELWKLFKEHKIVIPYPQQDVYLHKVPDELMGLGKGT
jgi:potassium-dependent mechanosensitive channel